MKTVDSSTIDHSASIRHKLLEGETSAWKRYALLVIGEVSVWKLFKYEMITLFFGSLPGALGLALRQIFYPKLFKKSGRGVVFGRNLVIRNAGNIELGDGVVIDDGVLIDARGAGEKGIVIEAGVILNREAVVIAKVGSIHVGENTDVGSRALLISTGGIRVGKNVGLAGECKIGGSMSRLEQPEGGEYEENAAGDQWSVQKFTKGPVVIGDQCIVFMQAIVLDGVNIGKRSMIGANIVLREDVPAETVVAAHQKLVILPMGAGGGNAEPQSKPVNTPREVQQSKGSSAAQEQDAASSDVHDTVVNAVYAAIDELNLLRGPEAKLQKQLDTELDLLESMDLVNLIVATEEQIEEIFGFSVNLNEEAAAQGREALKTLKSYIAQVEIVVNKHKG
jgi:acetyltransferase-like isoleucine patch superfamily enzyme